ncbi:hypothetical protein JCM10908_000088 [Rhodotorula pacifica]|uniref:uncharacterized protein n=1 Tax=Rhodotorula pacifica TaxID=1495444 RepID=UPI0031746544
MATEEVDYYALLGIESTATSAEIRKAYRQKSLKVHPDRNPDDPQAAALFHELSIAADVLSDPTQRASFDALHAARTARKARFAALDNKRKALAEDLEARERDFKKQKAGEATEAQRRRQELERLKEEGRKLREMKMNQANAGEEARKREEAEQADLARRAREAAKGGAAAMNGPAGVVELGPLDKTLKVKWLKSVHPALASPEALTTFFRTVLAPLDPDIDSIVISSKTLAQSSSTSSSKGKFGSGVVAFRSLSAAVRAVKGKAADPEGLWRGFEVDWAAGHPPAALGAGQAGATAAPTPVPAPPFSRPTPVRHISPSSESALAFKSNPLGADEDSVLAKLRQRERERERLMEEMRRQDDEEVGGEAPATAPATPPPSQPVLTKPELYISGLTSAVKDTEIVHVLRDCLKIRLHLKRNPEDATAPLTGKVEFESLDRAEKAYATCNNARLGGLHPGLLKLSINRDSLLDPIPAARPLILKQLPDRFTPSELFDLARPHGAVHSAVLLFSSPWPGIDPPVFKGQALVTYYNEEDAVQARMGLHLLEVQGQNIAVQVYDPKRDARNRLPHTNPVIPPALASGPGSSKSPLDLLRRSSSPETPSPLERKTAALLGLGISPASSTSDSSPSPLGSQRRHTSASKWATGDGIASAEKRSAVDNVTGSSSRSGGASGSGGGAVSAGVESLTSKMSQLAATPETPAVRPKSERDRLVEQVALLIEDESDCAAVLSLLCELPKKDRAMCLFNPDYLRAKVQDALAVLDVVQEEKEASKGAEAMSPEKKPAQALPDCLADLATWPSSQIRPLLPALAERFNLAGPASATMSETHAFMESLKGKPASEVKQKLGERLFKVVKELAKEEGLKGAPRITIELLDTEDDLGALAELMHYPAVLREKVVHAAGQLAGR